MNHPPTKRTASPTYLPARQTRREPLPDKALFALQLARVRLFEASIDRPPRPADASPIKAPRLETEVRLSRGEKAVGGRLTVKLTYPNAESPEYRMALTLEGTLVAADASVALPTKDQLDKRLACTVLTLLWPYAREFAHDLMRRMEVAPFPLPTLATQELGVDDQSRPVTAVCEGND
ncbi:MAG TPA: hypothetical protein PKW05_03870 [Anaerolineae bacterium]|nr:hypothetical protein [Anaerolineae bacterium]HQJ50900.1 hypothetical protein [Anaerolineae bacterium]